MDGVQLGLLLGLIAFFAYVVKGLTGAGPAIVFVSIGSVFHNPIEVIVLVSLLDVLSGGYLIGLNTEFLDNREYWLSIGLSMIIGAIIGSISLYIVPSGVFELILGIAIVLIAVWFLLGSSEPTNKSNNEVEAYKHTDGAIGIFSGFSGGFTGMGGPPLIIYLSSKFNKDLFRAVIVPIFLMASLSRLTTYSVLGMMSFETVWVFIIPPLSVFLGTYIGNNYFEKVEQKWFTVLIGLILLFSGLQLIIGVI